MMQADLAAERTRLLEEAMARRHAIEEGMQAQLELAREESLSLKARLLREEAEAFASIDNKMQQVASSGG